MAFDHVYRTLPELSAEPNSAGRRSVYEECETSVVAGSGHCSAAPMIRPSKVDDCDVWSKESQIVHMKSQFGALVE
jgi:hypothetical protein